MNCVNKKVKKIEFKNDQISYYVMGTQGKETILMLHPAFADHQIFKSQLDFFMDRYQVLLIDMPGHGEGQIKGSKVTLGDMPEIINEILSENDIIACHLLGVSMGSLVAQAFAERYPTRVKSVMIVGGYSIHKANERILKEQRKEGLKWLWYIVFSMKKFRSYVTSVSSHTDQGREIFAQGAQHFNRRSFTAMAGMSSFFTKKANPVPYPLLIIIGEHDLQLIQESAIELNRLEEQSQLVLVTGAGHCVNVDAPDEFNNIVENFL